MMDVRSGAPVLIVDDDLFVGRAVACMLTEARGARVEVARDGREALELAARVTPALIILDYRLPDTDPLSLCEKLRNLPGLSHVSICLLTGMLLDDDTLAALRDVLTEVLTKPPDLRELLRLYDHVWSAAA